MDEMYQYQLERFVDPIEAAGYSQPVRASRATGGLDAG
jgi:hypothetical protein